MPFALLRLHNFISPKMVYYWTLSIKLAWLVASGARYGTKPPVFCPGRIPGRAHRDNRADLSGRAWSRFCNQHCNGCARESTMELDCVRPDHRVEKQTPRKAGCPRKTQVPIESSAHDALPRSFLRAWIFLAAF